MDAELAYMFRHVLMRECAYGLMLPGERALRHADAVHAFEFILGPPPPVPLDTDDVPGAQEYHASDAHCLQLAQHARLAREADGRHDFDYRAREATCLHRAAVHAERMFQHTEAYRSWLQLAEVSTGRDRARALYGAGAVAGYSLGDVDGALALIDAALREAVDCGSNKLEVANLCARAEMLERKGLVTEAEAAARKALAISEASDDTLGCAGALNTLGYILMYRRQTEQALDSFSRAMLLGERLNRTDIRCAAATNLAILHHDSGHLDEALRLYARALEVAQQAGNLAFEGSILANLATAHADADDLEAAIAATTQALEIHEQTGNRRSRAIARMNLAKYLSSSPDPARALELATTVVNDMQGTGDTRLVSAALQTLGDVYLQAGRPRESLAALDKALAIQQSSGDQRRTATTLSTKAVALALMNNRAEAHGLWADGMQSLQRLGDGVGISNLYRLMKTVLLRAGIAPLPEQPDT